MLVHAGVTDTNVTYGPPSDWVKPQFFDQSASANLSDAGVDERLLLMEQQINARSNEVFFHYDRQILTLDGVQNGSTLKVNFNPNYQTITFHWVRIWRGGKHLDRLDTDKIQVVQQEQDLDAFTLNGEKTAILVLDDVRIGDIIDYSYSIKGENPVFGGHFSGIVPVQTDQPADRLLTRVLWPTGKPIFEKMHSCSVPPAVAAGKVTTELEWDFRQVHGLSIEDSLPSWYDPIQWVQLSDFRTWAEVNQWALQLFQFTTLFSPELARQVAEWKRIPGQEKQVQAVLRFVQDDVRYFGIEIGEGTERPADPSTVFARRFGDCKDKALLLVSILRAMGIEAYPVLVNSTLDGTIDQWIPSAGAFDHCIAEVRCNDQMYWLDPTINYQRGPLAAHYLPSYTRGLVIAPRTKDLSVIPQATDLTQTTTTEYFELQGSQAPTDLKVVTAAQGRDAEALRAMFATTKMSDIERDYTHFYAMLYPGVKMSSAIEVDDDQEQNIFQTTEYYSIDNMWTRPDATSSYGCEFYPYSIKAFLKKPVSTDRTYPLGISFPEHQILRTEVTMPRPCLYTAIDKTVSDPAFTFRKSTGRLGNKLVIQYEYQSLGDSVSPDDVADYMERLDECSKLLGDSVTWQ